MTDFTDAIIQRLQQHCPLFTTLDHPWFMEALDQLDQQTPAALVWLSADQAQGAPQSTLAHQQLMQTYGIWVIAPRHQLEQARTEIRTTLLGWQPEDTTDSAHYIKGSAENISGDLVWWREYWALPTWIYQTSLP